MENGGLSAATVAEVLSASMENRGRIAETVVEVLSASMKSGGRIVSYAHQSVRVKTVFSHT